MQHRLSGKRRWYNSAMRTVMLACTCICAALALFILAYVVAIGLPHITWELLSTKTSYLTDIDLLDAVYESTEEIQALARERDVTLSVSGSHLLITGSEKWLYEILTNLLDNAVKYNVEGGEVRIDVRQEMKYAVIDIRDTGIGIPPEHLDRIFERFYRVDKSHSRASGGTGLGLSIVKHAVAYHGGQVSVESTVGEGTQIQVRLPLAPNSAGRPSWQ